MATPIKDTPTLRGGDAERFLAAIAGNRGKRVSKEVANYEKVSRVVTDRDMI